jgi:titin
VPLEFLIMLVVGRRARRVRSSVVAALTSVVLVLGAAPNPATAATPPAADTTAPTWGEVTVTPATVSTGATSATVTVTAHILDDQAGITASTPSYGGGASLTFRVPGSDQSVFASLSASNRISGTETDGVYRATISLPRYTAKGVWSIASAYVTDAANNSRSLYSPAELTAAGLTASFEQTAAGDTTAPKFAGLTFTPDSVDTSAGARTITARVRITDDLSGMDASGGAQGGSASINLRGPNGTGSAYFYVTGYNRVAGTNTDGEYEASFAVPRYSQPGTWTIGSAFLRDAAGNTHSTSVAEDGLDATFDQTGPGDSAAPAISEVTVTPRSVNTSASTQGLTVRARITDDLAGITDASAAGGGGSATVNFSSSTGTAYPSASFSAANRISGTPTDGVYETTMYVPRGATGNYIASNGWATDAAGNYRYLAPSDFGSAAFGVVDTVAVPSAPTAVTATAGNGQVTVNWAAPARDNGAAITQYRITATPGPSGILGDPDPCVMPVTGSTLGGSTVTTLVDGSTLSATLTGLTNGAGYTVTVQAANSAGWGDTSAPTAKVKPFDPANDTNPPVLRSLDFSPAPVDTTAGPATVTITARICDDLAGSAKYYPYSGLVLRSPSGRQSLYASFTEQSRTAGGPLDGTYQVKVVLPQYSEAGLWTATVTLSDALNNTATLSSGQLAAAGFPAGVNQTGTLSDTAPPVLRNLTLEPGSVDTSGDARTISVTARITDDLSGLAPTARPSLSFRSPSGRQMASASLTLQSGSGQDGIWAGSTAIPRYSETGTWVAAGVYFNDVNGNAASTGAADLAAAGLPSSFTQTGAADTTAPTLAGITIAPAAVDSSAAAQTVAIRAHVTDDRAGIGPNSYGVSVTVRSPSGRQTAGGYSSTLQSGTPTDGVWEMNVTAPRDSEQGRWTIASLSLIDQMQNRRSLSGDDLAAGGYANSFEQTGAGDTSPPVVRSLSFTPDPVDTTAAGRAVTISTRLTDDRSGVSGLSAQIVAPSGGQPYYVWFTRTSGDGRDGQWEGRLTLPRYAEAGTWRISTLSVNDTVANVATLTAADLRAAGLPSGFAQTGTADRTAPQLAELTFTPGSVDTAAANRTVTVRARFTDDLSGLPAPYGANIVLASPSGQQTVYGGLQRIAGSNLDATYEGDVAVPRYSEAGAWTVKDLHLADLAGNVRHVTAADITAAGGGLGTGFTQTGSGDTQPPALIAVSAAPASIDTSADQATVTVSARIREDGAGLASYLSKLVFTSPSGSQTVTGYYYGSMGYGPAEDGTYPVTLTVPRYAEAGTWRLTGVELVDQVGNKSTLDAAGLAGAGLAASFQQTGTVSDREAPKLVDLSVTPDAVNVATSAQRVTVRAHVTDNLSGAYGSPGVVLTSPSGNQRLTADFVDYARISGTARDGVYQATIIVPYKAEAGSWTVTATLRDGAGNTADFDAAALAGRGFPSALAVQAEVAPSAPGAPWGVSAAGGNGSAVVTWHAPADDGGSPLSGYTVTARSGGTVVSTVDVDPSASSVEIGGLDNGVAYTFTVTATNAVGTGPESLASNTTTPATVPDAPAGVSASAGSNSATVIWDTPTGDGGSAITTYRVTVRTAVSGPDGAAVKTVSAAPPAAGVQVTGLTNGVAYTFTVTAVNAVGTGPESALSEPVTPVGLPSSPSGVTGAAGNAAATVSWSAPADTGGSPVVSYTVTVLTGTTVVRTGSVDAPATSLTVSGLANGTAYKFTVAATNSIGTGAASAPSAAVTPVTTPDAPTNVTATAGDGSAVVKWTAPASNGGTTLTGYTITAYDGGTVAKTVTASKSATQVTVSGLDNGVTYRFTVTASNAVGAGTASNPSRDVSPVAAPPTSSTSTSSTTTTTTTGPQSPTTTTTTTTTTAPPAPVPVSPAKVRSGYWMVGADGRVFAFGDAAQLGEPRGQLGGAQAVDLEPAKSGNGYWVLDDTGRVFAYGDARSYGNVDRARLTAGERATSLSRTASGAGYWIFTSRGRVLTFGDAAFLGDVSGLTLAGPVLDSIATPSGKGYYMVASDGGIFAFGDARFFGSMGGKKLNAPVQSLVPDGDGEGYWLVASDGGIFAFNAPFRGSMGGRPLNKPVSGMVPFGNGYLMVGEDGGIFNFSDRLFLGSLGATPPARPVIAVAVLDS